ncbi:HIT family hydrolase, diadenosine tetraphosphate hydrolase [Rhodanobacter fulvus Jip2]|uniref:HIT family hydrolase, diadenosine tetraphosphate hydrolase n=1 Tax=Rhodanobacter fulvus Jip2 TaxID=1163408 RepID=I4VK86_9GAMM|nr:HIT family protein [Rhodanobacter fulvus]EIL87627.1 HIT family hydrolase, diadenosine tetraphosphate hydrolase [Rhodanobacter fulvus Jip2]
MSFTLDPRLAADTLALTTLPLCEVRLMNDARYAWLVLVPRQPGLAEVTDLADDERARLWREVDQAAATLRSVAPCDKLNIGALGNIVRQLHVHVVARCEGDDAWPGPVWGHGASVPYPQDEATARLTALRQHWGHEKARD